ncbi:hypothetical protein [Nocardioides sp. cx-173]|uniref:hypothetical protein n=1 Tax=Nocardioides sp. cx-173 TaxID=2898796 RepID=UPI001E353159|nr:hypothetical protein [Nocardioides sp. cx-173]MCD4526468.1 hypothetical protein [Nocardioides sp. cx-173]UGB41156.1 hypothetical protein LQ940_17515 [Nocardioides sp. cx-173]
MSNYYELESLIGKIKRAAIDVYMTDQANFYEIDGDRYRYRGSGRGAPQYCTRPGEDGEGGGDVSMGGGMPDFLVNHLDADFRAAFGNIRGQVDAIFTSLKDVPSGASLMFEESRSMDAAEKLTPKGATTSLPAGGGSSLNLNNAALSQRVNAVHGYSYRLSSRTINAFRVAYADRLGAILDAQAALAATMGMAAAGQTAVFTKLREDIATFAANALASLNALAGVQSAGQGPGGGHFAVGGALLTIASLSGGPGTAALAALGAVGGLIADLWPDAPAKKELEFKGSNLESMMQSIADAKTTLLRTPVEDETAIRQALTNASAAIRQSPASFDISRPEYPRGGGEDVGGPGTIQHNRNDMQQLAATCQLVSDDVDGARLLVAGADGGRGEWRRPEGIGIGPNGPYDAFRDLGSDLVALTRNTAAELAEAATKLIAASLDLDATDADVAQALAREIREVKQAEAAGDLLFE